jgi:hypothetical protein
VAAKGHSRREGAILLGVKEDIMKVEDWEVGEYFIATVIRNRLENWRWRMVTVYGPTDHENLASFLQEMDRYRRSSVLPIIIGGALI